MIAIRILAAVLAVLATVPAEAARQAKPAPEPPPFPQHDDRFVMAVRGPVVGGRAGFARVYASPAGRDGWDDDGDLRDRRRPDWVRADRAPSPRERLPGPDLVHRHMDAPGRRRPLRREPDADMERDPPGRPRRNGRDERAVPLRRRRRLVGRLRPSCPGARPGIPDHAGDGGPRHGQDVRGGVDAVRPWGGSDDVARPRRRRDRGRQSPERPQRLHMTAAVPELMSVPALHSEPHTAGWGRAG